MSSTKVAKEFLERQGYTPTGAQGNRASLSYTLLLLSHYAPPSVLPKGMQVVATLLEQEAANQCTEMVTATVMSRLHPILDKMELAVENIQGATEGTWQAADRLYSTCEEARDESMSADMTAAVEGAVIIRSQS